MGQYLKCLPTQHAPPDSVHKARDLLKQYQSTLAHQDSLLQRYAARLSGNRTVLGTPPHSPFVSTRLADRHAAGTPDADTTAASRLPRVRLAAPSEVGGVPKFKVRTEASKGKIGLRLALTMCAPPGPYCCRREDVYR